MARIEDLVSHVRDPALRRELEDALAELKRRKQFGLVFEEHIPETTALAGLPITVGAFVQKRKDPEAKTYRVQSVARGVATLVAGDEAVEEVAVADLLVLKRFGEPIYPTLQPLGAVDRGGDRPHHAVINGENYHALQLLAFAYKGQVDCIYIDPPYNTGAKDWKYNNRFVDVKASYRHSKWLSFMEKRLAIAKVLLKPDGVLIVTIDEHEVHHLGMLIERLFKSPDYLRQMVTIVINPKGTRKQNFARVDEYAMYVLPNAGRTLIAPRTLTEAERNAGGAAPELFSEDQATAAIDEALLDQLAEDESAANGDDETSPEEDESGTDADEKWEWRHARRRGTESSYRTQRENQFYPIYVDEAARKVVRAGASIPLDQRPDLRLVDGLRPIWPIDHEGNERCWYFIPSSMQLLIDFDRVRLGRYNREHDTWTLNFAVPRNDLRKLKTVWWEKRHDAGTHGTALLKRLLGRANLFPFPKSVYAVRDCLAAVVAKRPDALIIDFFAGSGTTFHATCMLNAEDEGRRHCVLVTNNEVAAKTAEKLNARGVYRGDAEFEAHGIFEEVTRPRCEAVVRGLRPDGQPIPGKDLSGRRFRDGFAENVDFFALGYLDRDEIELGRRFAQLLPLVWLASGAVGSREVGSDAGYALPGGARFGVLFDESSFGSFRDALRQRPDVTHVWLITDSPEAYAEMRDQLDRRLWIARLYDDYLTAFRSTERPQ